MNIVISPNSFKGALSSQKVADYIERGLTSSGLTSSGLKKSLLLKTEILKIPLADGGDGTLSVIIEAKGGSTSGGSTSCGKTYKKQVTGPLGTPIDAEYGILSASPTLHLSDNTAVIELAKIAGLSLLPKFLPHWA
ncbi:MAG: glycerate kinase [Candidatus Stahlbacteria bacterium]|nr:glycerate kinase [Candidatus Stahlbacteria bacterium]